MALLSGINQEYLASTQISHPTLESTTETHEVPAPAPLTACTPEATEGLEAARVVVSGGSIPATFAPGTDEYEDYLRYGQWPLKVGACTALTMMSA
jgi:hypothetical protein